MFYDMCYNGLFYVKKPRQSFCNLGSFSSLMQMFQSAGNIHLLEHRKLLGSQIQTWKVTILVIFNVENIECLGLLGNLNVLTSMNVCLLSDLVSRRGGR
jgi:hypothetical protein